MVAGSCVTPGRNGFPAAGTKLEVIVCSRRVSLKEVPSEWSPLASTKGEESRDVFIAMRVAGKVLSRLNGKRNIKLTDILTSVA